MRTGGVGSCERFIVVCSRMRGNKRYSGRGQGPASEDGPYEYGLVAAASA
jgi:hypothetical protein